MANLNYEKSVVILLKSIANKNCNGREGALFKYEKGERRDQRFVEKKKIAP